MAAICKPESTGAIFQGGHVYMTADILIISADPGRRKGERVREEDGRKGLAAASRHVCLRGSSSSSIEQEEQQQK